jgi:uncharacterized protein YcgL (UPF0745 family)
MTENTLIPCWVYRSGKKAEMYLYLAVENNFEPLPAALKQLFGEPAFVMRLDLHQGRALAREDVRQVMRNLQEQGFHLQMPPALKPDIFHA